MPKHVKKKKTMLLKSRNTKDLLKNIDSNTSLQPPWWLQLCTVGSLPLPRPLGKQCRRCWCLRNATCCRNIPRSTIGRRRPIAEKLWGMLTKPNFRKFLGEYSYCMLLYAIVTSGTHCTWKTPFLQVIFLRVTADSWRLWLDGVAMHCSCTCVQSSMVQQSEWP